MLYREDVVRDIEMELNRSHNVLRSIEILTEILDVALLRYGGQSEDEMMGTGLIFIYRPSVEIISECGIWTLRLPALNGSLLLC